MAECMMFRVPPFKSHFLKQSVGFAHYKTGLAKSRVSFTDGDIPYSPAH